MYGVAISDSRIYLIQCECNWIKVYDACHPYEFLGDIKVRDMTNPSDILAFDHCLYIPDNMTPTCHHYFGMRSDCDHRVWKIRLSESASFSVQPEKTLMSLKKWWPWTLSRASDGKIIITTLTDKVYFWSPDPHAIETVTLPLSVCSAQHIIELSGQLYLICSRLCEPKVCQLVREGNKMNFVENSSSLDVQHPRHFAKLPDGRIVVPDHINNSVLVVENDLNSCKTLLCHGNNGRKRPCRVAYDGSSHQLLVAFHHSAGLYSLNDSFLQVQH